MSLIELGNVVVSDEKFKVVKEGEVEFDGVVYDEGEEVCCDDYVVGECEKGVLIYGDGYRGEMCYEGYVKIEGEWWWCDFVSDGVMWLVVEGVDILEGMV